MSLEVGQLLDNKYRIVRMIGEGGMGAVFEGENVRINRRVAIKVLHAAFAGNAEVMQRFEREAQAAGRIGNDHILEVLDLGVLPDGDRYIIMEFLEGEPLSSRIKNRGRMMPIELASVMRQVLVGLGAAHAVGIVHRDLKPDNIFILREKAGQRDYVKIIDFGISKFQPLSGDGMKMTRTGAVMGTPYYMSPEQASGSSEADARSDVYSLGVIMYEAVTGRVPFDAGTFNQLMFKIVLADVPPPQSVVPDLDPAFASIVSKAMARDVSQRFQSTADVIQALDAWVRSGQAVAVPVANAEASAALLPAGARANMGSISDGGVARPYEAAQATAGTWATSSPGIAGAHAPLAGAAKKSAGPALAALAVIGVLVLGGAAFAAYSMFGKQPAPASSAAALASGSPATATATPTPEPSAPTPPSSPATTASASATPDPSTAPAASAAAAETKPLATGAVRPAAPPKPIKPTPRPNSGTAAPAPSPVKPGTPDFGY